MLTKVQKWGNSLALRIPRALALDTHLTDESEVDLSVTKGRLLITPLGRARLRLGSLLARVRPSNLHGEIDFGRPAGREAL